MEGGTIPSPSLFAGTSVASFHIANTEVTWGEWQEIRAWAVTNGYTDLAGVGAGSGVDHPVHSVDWYDVVKWCNAKSEKEGLEPVYTLSGAVYRSGVFGRNGSASLRANLTAAGYRLPTNAEWEWAARGGAKSRGFRYSGSDDKNAVAWYSDNSGGATKAVGTKSANEIGVHDMNGNVMEHCEDPNNGGWRMRRGGSYTTLDFPAYGFPETGWVMNERLANLGFRLAATLTPTPEPTPTPTPEPAIRIEEPVGTDLASNVSAKTFGSLLMGTSSISRVYTIRNMGSGPLNSIALTKLGIHSSDFTMTPVATSIVAAGESTTFSVAFTPTAGGLRTAQISIISNDTNNSPFIINLSGFGIGDNLDTDSDGLNDAAEFTMSALGFDWQSNQPALVTALYSNANRANLFTQSQYDSNRTNGQTDVATNPSAFNLFTQSQFDGNRTAGQQDVIASPMAYGLYDSNSIMDLRMGGLMIQKQGTDAAVVFQPQTTTDLTQPFTNNGTPITNTVPMPGNKGFIRINAQPHPMPVVD